jgi:hypothetical protein
VVPIPALVVSVLVGTAHMVLVDWVLVGLAQDLVLVALAVDLVLASRVVMVARAALVLANLVPAVLPILTSGRVVALVAIMARVLVTSMPIWTFVPPSRV